MIDARTLTAQLGGEWRGDAGLAPCPICQSERRRDQRALSLRSEGEKLLAYCHKSGCDYRAICDSIGMTAASDTLDIQAQSVEEQHHQEVQFEQRRRARRLWGMSEPIGGTKAECYLRARGISVQLPETLRFIRDTYHSLSGNWVAAMVGDVSTGGVHRTFFNKNGARLAKNAKMMLGPCSGGAVTLSDGTGPLVVCEGIETGLSLVQLLRDRSPTVWAALSTSGIKGLVLPQEPADILIAPDGDAAGHEAASRLADRADALGWGVSLLPPPDGQDWNDVLRREVAA